MKRCLAALLLVGCTGEETPAGPVVDAANDQGVVADVGDAAPRAQWKISRVEAVDGWSFQEIPGFSLTPDEETLYYATYLGNPCASSGSGYDLYVGTRTSFGRYVAKRIASLSTRWRESSPMIARDGSFLLFAREDNTDCTTKLGYHLWYAPRVGADFGTPIRLDALRAPSSDPAMKEVMAFARGDELFYVVTLPKGSDWTSQIHHAIGAPGAWKDGAPLPAPIGGAYKDEYPFLTHDGAWLYFNSDRPGGVGGNGDIWRARRLGPGAYEAPEALPYPINSPAWDGVPRVSDDGKRVYFQRGSDIWVAQAIEAP